MSIVESFFRNPLLVNETVGVIIAVLVVFDIAWRAIKKMQKQKEPHQ